MFPKGLPRGGAIYALKQISTGRIDGCRKSIKKTPKSLPRGFLVTKFMTQLPLEKKLKRKLLSDVQNNFLILNCRNR